MGIVAGDRVTPDFLLALMQTIRLGAFAQIGAVPSVNQSHVGSVPIVLPPLPEQRRITAILAAAEDCESAASRALEAARRTRSAVLMDLLSGNHEIPSSYDRFLEAA
jgi:type I restriction enzyme S subunit